MRGTVACSWLRLLEIEVPMKHPQQNWTHSKQDPKNHISFMSHEQYPALNSLYTPKEAAGLQWPKPAIKQPIIGIPVTKRAQDAPNSLDMISNMPGHYHTNRSQCQTHRTCPLKSAHRVQGKIEAKLQEIVDLKVITLETRLTKWVSSLTYPRKPDGSLQVCLDPRDLDKAILWEYYKAPTLGEISHHLRSNSFLLSPCQENVLQ